MICWDRAKEKHEIRISISTDKYFKYNGDRKPYFYTGDNLALYELPILAPDLLTWWHDETSIR